MTMRMICDACGNRIDDDDPRRELVSNDDQRHYHADPQPSATESCWQTVKQAINAAESTRRSSG